MESLLVILLIGGLCTYIGMGTLLEARAFRQVAARTDLAQVGRQLEGDYNGVPVVIAAEHRPGNRHHDEWTVVQARLAAPADSAVDAPAIEEVVEACKKRQPVVVVENDELRAELPGGINRAGELIDVLDAVTECASRINGAGK